MTLLYETSILGLAVKVFSDRVEYKTGLGGALEVIPIAQIASIKLGSFLVNRLTIETTGGREYVVTTGNKKEVAAANSAAAHRSAAAIKGGGLVLVLRREFRCVDMAAVPLGREDKQSDA